LETLLGCGEKATEALRGDCSAIETLALLTTSPGEWYPGDDALLLKTVLVPFSFNIDIFFVGNIRLYYCCDFLQTSTCSFVTLRAGYYSRVYYILPEMIAGCF